MCLLFLAPTYKYMTELRRYLGTERMGMRGEDYYIRSVLFNFDESRIFLVRVIC
jgi:hypothetical protein